MIGGVSHEEVGGWVADLFTPTDDYDELLERVATACRLKNWADAAMVDCTRRATQCPTGADEGPDATGSRDTAGKGAGSHAGTTALLQGATKQSAKEAAAAAKRAALFGRAPALGDAQARGDINAAHLDALSRTVARANAKERESLLADPAALVLAAAAMTPEQFQAHCDKLLRDLSHDDGLERAERQRRDSYLRTWTDDTSQMLCGRFALDPERGRRLLNALDAEIQQLFSQQPDDPSTATEVLLGRLGAQALCNLVGSGHVTQRPASPDLHVLIDYESLIHGLHAHTICELSDGTQIPIGTARRLACNANILPVLLGSTGEVLDLGCEVRLANRAQRRAIRAMYRTCAADGCTVPVDRCDIHHVRWWELLGPTDLANLVPLCDRHHHMVHEGGWHLTIDAATRDLTLIRPDGELHSISRFADISRAGRRTRTRSGPPGRPDTGPGDSRRRPPPGPDQRPGPDPTPHVEPTLFADAS